MEEIPPNYEVREYLKGLRIKSGFRLFMIFFTDIKMYLVETDHTSHHTTIGWGFLMNTIRTKISSEKQYERFEMMKDAREIYNASCWSRTYMYGNIVSMWIEEGEGDLNKLWFDIIASDKRKKYYGEKDGADYLWFKKELADEYVRILTKMLDYKFHGIKGSDQ